MKLLSTLAVKGVLDELGPAFERARGVTIEIVFDPTAVMLPRIRAGEQADIAILTRDGIDRLIADGVLAAGSRLDLARSEVGIAVAAGARKPDISTVEAFRRTLLDAKSIVYSRAGASGIFFARLIDELGVAAEVNAKATIVPGGFTAETVAAGKAEIAVQQVSELMVVPGVDVVGALPQAIQEYLDFAGAVFAGAADEATGAELLRFLAGAEHAAVYKRRGLLGLTGS